MTLFRIRQCIGFHKFSGPIESRGFTLIELMVTLAITVMVVAGSTTTWMVATRDSRKGGVEVQFDALMEKDMARILEEGNRFTCCPGTCTSDASIIADSADCPTTPGVESYYVPPQTDPVVDSAAMQYFRQQCRDQGALAEDFIAEALPPSLLSDQRTVSVADPVSNRIRIKYSGSTAQKGVLRRVEEFIPPVARWCP